MNYFTADDRRLTRKEINIGYESQKNTSSYNRNSNRERLLIIATFRGETPFEGGGEGNRPTG